MTPELWQRLKPLFHAAVDRDPAERAEFIDEVCAEDPELKLQLNALVHAEEQGTEALGGPLVDLRSLVNNRAVGFHADQVILDRFRIVRSIGTGGMGEVYEAVDLQLGTIALKTIRQDIASSKNAFERFRHEVQLARRVSGPQVCRIHELFLLPASGRQPATSFLTMELLDGVTLTSKLRDDGPMAWKEALPLALEICEGLRLIHEKGIIHRDLKTGNIMVCKHNGSTRTVLMDFGLAHDFSTNSDSGDPTAAHAPFQTMAGAIMGTPAYMAPEQFEGGPVSPATDIYALGIILYEMVTGIHPYSSNTPIAAAIRRAKHPMPASSIQRAIPRHWDRIIERCLEFEPEKRFQSAAEVSKALRAGPANLANLRDDQPWVIPVAYVLMVAFLSWSTFLWWQARQQYHPGTEALRWYDAGVAALGEGNNVKATRSLQQAIAQDNHFVMAHARLAEAWANLDFDGNAQRELLVATPGGRELQPIDRMYLEGIHAIVTKDPSSQIRTYRQILDRLPPDKKPSGYVDLGMAYERAGDPPHALENYAQAASLDSNNPASYMHTAILQSRLHHLPLADQAFRRAQELLSLEMNQEGIAELDYERGYAANDAGDPALAEHYLQKALEEAKAIPSVQLQIRTLTQLSSAACSSDRNEQAVKDAEEAIRLAQSNQLDVWAANGFVRLANAELQQGNLQKAEDAVQEALQLSRQGQQRRIEAGANLTLASIMDQRQLPDQVIAPAQSALSFYTKNGFFRPAANASLLLIRAQRGRGEYSQALEAGRAFQQLAAKSGVRQLVTLSEEVVGTVYLEMEQYPSALGLFQSARSDADGIHAKAYQAMHCAEVLWRLARYSESDEMLNSVPATKTFGPQSATVRVSSLLSRLKYKEADALVQKTLAEYPTMALDRKQELELDDALAESHLKMKPTTSKHLQDVSNQQNKFTVDDWRTKLSVAELDLSLGMAQQALDGATSAADHFSATNRLDSELRSLCIGASASKLLNNAAAYERFSRKAVDILSQMQQTWEPRALTSYLSRADLQALMREASVPAPLNRR